MIPRHLHFSDDYRPDPVTKLLVVAFFGGLVGLFVLVAQAVFG